MKLNLELKDANVKITIIRASPPFGRAIALKIGYQYLQTLELEEDKTIVFSLDTSMQIPITFSKLLMKSITCGLTVFAPVCKKGDLWVEGGYGMIGMCLSDYGKLDDGWNEKWGYKWGAEDVDIISQAKKKFIPIRPIKVNIFIQVHIKKKIIIKMLIYMIIIYQSVPVTFEEKNEKMIQLITTFIANELNEIIQYENILFTDLSSSDIRIYSIYIKDSPDTN